MRTIKFRAWNGEQMVSPDYIDRKGIAHWKENSIPTSSEKVMQFTGLLDKNGKEIYEGDIIVQPELYHQKSLNKKPQEGIVYWNEEDARFSIRSKNGYFMVLNPSECEVIGNIYER